MSSSWDSGTQGTLHSRRGSSTCRRSRKIRSKSLIFGNLAAGWRIVEVNSSFFFIFLFYWNLVFLLCCLMLQILWYTVIQWYTLWSIKIRSEIVASAETFGRLRCLRSLVGRMSGMYDYIQSKPWWSLPSYEWHVPGLSWLLMEDVGFLGKALFVRIHEETEPSSHKQVDRESEMYPVSWCVLPYPKAHIKGATCGWPTMASEISWCPIQLSPQSWDATSLDVFMQHHTPSCNMKVRYLSCIQPYFATHYDTFTRHLRRSVYWFKVIPASTTPHWATWFHSLCPQMGVVWCCQPGSVGKHVDNGLCCV